MYDGQNLNLTVNEGGATLSLTGTGSGSAMGGTYSLVASGCGKDDSGTFTATQIKPLNGALQGVLHSTKNQGVLQGGDFAMTGEILQGDNIGASTAQVTGTISSPNFPCFANATLSGTISGASLQLNIIGLTGAVIGSIGTSSSFPVLVRTDGSGFSGFGGITGGAGPYLVDHAPTCFLNNTGTVDTRDSGSVCVDIGTATSCKQTVAFSVNPLVFSPVLVGLGTASQTVTLTNQSAAAIDLGNFGTVPGSEFTADVSACGTALAARSNCSITVAFSPDAACPPFGLGAPASSPLVCPLPITAPLSLSVPNDPDSPHALLLSGTGVDAVNPDVIEHNFGVVPVNTVSSPSTVNLVNFGTAPVTISGVFTGGLDINGNFVPCDPAMQPLCNFVTASQVRPRTCQPAALTDSCTGQTLAPLASCRVDIVYCPTTGTGGNTDTLYLEIMTDERKQDGTPTLDATRVVVQLDGKSQ